MTAVGANEVEFHARLRSTLLRLEEDSLMLFAGRALLRDTRQRRILANVLRYACCVADLVGELVAEDACRLGVFAVVTRAAGKLELACVLVFSRVE